MMARAWMFDVAVLIGGIVLGSPDHKLPAANEPFASNRLAVSSTADGPAGVGGRIRLRFRAGHRSHGAGDLDGADDGISRRPATKTARRERGGFRLLRRGADRGYR